MLARKRKRPKAVKTRGEGRIKNKSWVPGRKGQGGEGLSHGYGGSATTVPLWPNTLFQSIRAPSQ